MSPDFVPSLDPLMDAGSLKDLVASPRYVRFGPFLVDRQRQQVSRGGTRLRLQGKVYQVLVVLIQKQGEVVTREELRQALWPADTHVNYDANVNTTVNKLRQAGRVHREAHLHRNHSTEGLQLYWQRRVCRGAFSG